MFYNSGVMTLNFSVFFNVFYSFTIFRY